MKVEKLDILLLVQAVVHTLYLVVNLGVDGTVFHLKTAELPHLLEGAAYSYVHRLSVVTASYFYTLYFHIDNTFHILNFIGFDKPFAKVRFCRRKNKEIHYFFAVR